MPIVWLTHSPGRPVARLLERLAPNVVVRAAGPDDGRDDRLFWHEPWDAAGGAGGVLALGWATVELDRATAALGAIVGPGVSPAPLADDPHLGARCRLIAPWGRGRAVILLEPVTEGRLAASLARFGEGPAAIYLSLGPGVLAGAVEWIRGSGGVVSRPEDGPLGRSALVLGGRAWGPHAVLVEEPGSRGADPGTIAR